MTSEQDQQVQPGKSITDLKRGATFSFVGGELRLRLSGWEGQDGWATLRFDEEALVPAREDPVGHSVCFDIPPSELRALRDFLNQHFTVAHGINPNTTP